MQSEYKAAGVLPLAWHEGQLWALLGSEPTPQGLRWLAFGGKREPQDADARATALREYREESGGALCEPCLLPTTFYDWRAKFVLHLGWLDYAAALPSFSDAQAAAEPTLNKRELQWFPLEELLRGAQFEPDGAYPMKPWFQSLLQRERYAIRRAAQDIPIAAQ
jgi:8-oxo-dGTP pyrophosphatase MutT (NUDIX family)